MRLLLPVFLFLSTLSFAQKFTLSGNVKDATNGEDLIGLTIFVKELPGTGTVTNIYGFYSLTLPKGEYTIQYSYIGYQTQEFKLVFDKNIKKDVELGLGSTELQVVEISAEKEDANVRDNEMSVTKIDMKEIESIPVLFGERDVMKTLQLLPGVKSAGEGGAGFFVRGGGTDQNLILLDEAPVFNASHLLGFFSVFNSDAIKDLKLYKGGIPAQFGGRLSSVMDIKMKDGNSKKLGVSGGIGLISSKLTIEAPIVKDRGSFIISGRRTYADIFLAFSNDENIKNSILYFYDLNLKANYRLGENDRLFLSGYFGRDDLGLSGRFGFDWGNSTGTLRWNHLFNDKLFSNTSLIYSNYDYEINIIEAQFKIGANIQDINVKQDFDYFVNDKNKVKFGGNVIHHTFNPGQFASTGEQSVVNDIAIESRYSLESALYVSNEQKVNGLLTINYGLRFTNFTQIGPGEIYSYNSEGFITDTTQYSSFEPVVSYNGLAPRLSATYLLNEESSLKASYTRTYQNLHLLSNSTSGSPTDTWLPSSNNIKPESADQVALGYFRNFKDNTFEFSSEIYYKKFDNLIDYKIGANVTLNPTVEGELYFGEGRAYGLELFLKKRKGDFTGWISYTLARSEKLFDEINDREWFAAKQDRTHDVSLVGIYNITDRLSVSATWVYYTGNAVTVPLGKAEIDGQSVVVWSDRNGFRMPAYHRFDIGVTLKRKPYKEVMDQATQEVVQVPRKIEGSWNFSVYNLYGRDNPYSIDFEPDVPRILQTSLFGIPIPSISYNFKF